jgi:hypothetical protein
MHCPNCGTKVSGEQKFCRSCGMKLEKVQQILSEELSTAELHADDKIRRFEHWRNVAGLWTLVLFAAVLLVVFIHEIVINFGSGSHDFYGGLIGLALFLGTAIALSFAGYSAYLRQKQANRKAQVSEAASVAASTLKLPPEPHRIDIPSVTEGTTEILEKNLNPGGNNATQPHITAGVRSRDGEHSQDA